MIGLLKSKRSAWCLVVVGLAFALVLLGYMTGPDWAKLVQWITIALVAGHTVTGALAPVAAPAAVDTPKPTGV